MEIVCFAGPNGSGKSTIISKLLDDPSIPKNYICPDTIVRFPEFCSIKDERKRYIAAMNESERLREIAVENCEDFSFETVLSTKDKIKFLYDAKKRGYVIRSFFITTCDPEINIDRVAARVRSGGHNVPSDKIVARYERSMSLLSELIIISDYCVVFDNSNTGSSPKSVFRKDLDKHILLRHKEDPEGLYSSPKWVEQYIINPLIKRGYLSVSSRKLFNSKTHNHIILPRKISRMNRKRDS